ncbi:hypothetical protein ABZ805_28215 [Saccharopolyspora sp. NPDC047091]|uniref:hypothetical protein n=1 Tax=Saccharopolyspora sp. NPDC047091 TaxID=3155924 RepID=UPI003401C6F3
MTTSPRVKKCTPSVEPLARARLAASCATAGTAVRHAELHEIGGIGPRSVADVRRLVERVLGPVVAHDRASGTALLTSPEVFLRQDRS